jgi:hypothetical protein
MLSDYEDADICTLLEYGFPIGYENLETTYTGRHVNNHKGALENSADMDKYLINKGNNKITQLRTILQRESQNSKVYKQTKSVNNRKTVKTVMTLTWYRHF